MSMASDDDSYQPDEGAIDTSDGGQQAAPAAPQASASMPNMGPPPVAQEAAQDTVGQGMSKLGSQIGGDISQGMSNVAKSGPANVMKRIVSYLMGSDAENPAALDQAAAKVDPQGQMSGDDRNIMAIHQAHEEGGPEAAWKLMQANRVAYNAKQAFAATALNGINGKPADIAAAAQAATQASQHILDGSSINFTPDQQGGVTATVKMPGGQPQQISLTPPQFNQWLNVGGDGQWDKVMENGGAPATLQRISQGQGMPLKGPSPGGQGAATVGPSAPNTRAGVPAPQAPQPTQGGSDDTQAGPPPAQTNFGSTPSTLNLSGNTDQSPPQPPSQSNYGDELEDRSRKIFPNMSQEAQRQQWMAAQEEQQLNRENQVTVATEKGKQATERARVTGTGNVERQAKQNEGRVQTQQIRTEGNKDVAGIQANARLEGIKQRALQEAAKQERTSTDNAARERARNFRAELSNPNFVLQKPEDVARLAQKYGITQGGAPSGAPPAPPSGAAQNPPGTKMYNGKLYTRGPNGESVPYQP